MSSIINEPSGSHECKICEQPAHGVHFGVTTCRACAAFFRRSIVENRSYKCRQADFKCKILKTARDSCRYCRLQKCKTLGMTEENIQRNRDKLSLVQNAGSKQQASENPFLDLTELMKDLPRKFDNFRVREDDKVYMSKNRLERMEFALQTCRRHQKRGELEFITSLNTQEFVGSLLDGARQFSSWIVHSEEFRNLESSYKTAVFDSVWMLWIRFERLTMLLEIVGQRAIDEKIILLSENRAMSIDKVEFDFSVISDHEPDKIHDMFFPLSQKMFSNVAEPLLKIQPTSIEVTYMLCQIFWLTAGKKLQGQVLLAAENFLDEIANDLHEYYVKHQKRSNYASRLAQMMAVVRAMQQNHEERQKMFELARLFDVFKI